MIPPTHFLASWVLANTAPLNRRDRMLVTVAGVIPDIDGFGYPIENWLTINWEKPLLWHQTYHHLLCHNFVFAVIVGAGVLWFSGGKWLTLILAELSFHLHLLCDVIGSRGVDGYQWPIWYWVPFSMREWTWTGQWELSSWPNRVIGVTLFLITLVLAWRRGFSPVEMFSQKWDAVFVQTLRKWFPVRNVSVDASANPV